MTLLDDLRALDLSAIVDAKAEITATVQGEDLLALAGDGAAATVLGDLGRVIRSAVEGFEDPAALVEPITAALSAVLDRIGADLQIDDYVAAVASAARLVADVVRMISGDPHRIGFGGLDVGAALERVGGRFGDHAAVVSGGLARFRGLVETVENGLPSDPDALLGPALEIVLPFAIGPVDAARGWATQVASRLDRIDLDPGLTEGLVNALGRVRVAAEAGDAARVGAELRLLEQARVNTVQQLALALRAVASAVSAVRIDDGVRVLRDLRGTLADADETVFDLLDGWRAMIASVRETVESIDPTLAMQSFDAILDQVESAARDVLLAGIDGSVEIAKQWLRDLLREVPIRPLRLRLSEAIAEAAGAIRDADLDAPVAAVRGLLAEVSGVLADADPAALVQAAVARLEAVIRDALDRLADLIGRITRGIDQVADRAEGVLRRAVAGLRDFRGVVDEIRSAVDELGIVEAADEIAATLAALREQVSELVSKAPVPDELRGVVDQLVSTLESIDLDAAIGAPLREVATRLQIPADVATGLRDGLRSVADAVQALVPGEVIAELEAAMGDVLAEIGKLDVGPLVGGVTAVLDDAAGVFERVRITERIAPAGEVFARIVAAVDRVHPRVLLRPAIELYAQILGSIPVPDATTIATRAGSVTSQAGEAVARAAAEPARRAVGGSASLPPAGSGPRGGLGPAPEDPPTDLRPGDIVRLIGFLPRKLREALAVLGAGPAGELLAAIDSRLTGVAAALRGVRDRVVTIQGHVEAALDSALAPLAAAQIDAQLALRGSATLAAGGFDVNASLSLVASVGPASLARELNGERRLIADRCGAASGALTGAVAHDLDQVVELLDDVLPSGLLADLDAFLAALDPEPVAAELDALLGAIVDAAPAFLTAAETEIRALEARLRRLVDEFNPGKLMQRYLGVLDVVREELSLLDPGRLADELGEVHAEVKAALVAYDPNVLAGELEGLLAEVAAAIRGLDPAGLMPDLSGITAQVARVAEILPVNALAGVGEQLRSVGEELRAVDVQQMLDAVNALMPEVAEAIEVLIESVRAQLVALLKSIRYASAGASASAGGSLGVG